MRKGIDLLGKAIVAYETGKKFARVKDLIFDQDNNQLLALLVEEGNWLSHAQILPFSSIKAIGLDAVITATEDAVVPANQFPEINQVLKANNILKGTQILTTDGRNLGRMIDLYFDETTGAVEGYEVSGGLFADAYSGRSFVPAPKTLTIGEDVAFVPAEVSLLMEEQVGGLLRAMQTAGEKMQAAAQTTGEKLQEATTEATFLLQDAGRSATTLVTNAVVDPEAQKAFVIGKPADWAVVSPGGVVIVRSGEVVTAAAADAAEALEALDELYRATGGQIINELARKTDGLMAGLVVEQAKGHRVLQTVRTSEGVVVAAPGQIVTDRVIEQAKRYRREPELLDAVGLSTKDAVRHRTNISARFAGDNLGTATQSVGEQLSRGAVQVRVEAQSLWQQLKLRANHVQRCSARALEEQRIKNAIGRPVTRVLLNAQDQVILNVGDLITHQAIQQARQADVLDVLLNSVYAQTPEFSKAEMRAPESGKATLKPN